MIFTDCFISRRVLQMLLGMYRCTDIPGKFVWQPGSLTQAVSKGYWILLEDIDHAPLDVVSVLPYQSLSSTLFVLGTIGIYVFTRCRVRSSDIRAAAADGEQEADHSRPGGLHSGCPWLPVLRYETVRNNNGESVRVSTANFRATTMLVMLLHDLHSNLVLFWQ